jgi:hypothetical protein
MEKVVVSDDILLLASKYIEEKVVGQTSLDDCLTYCSRNNFQGRHAGKLEF